MIYVDIIIRFSVHETRARQERAKQRAKVGGFNLSGVEFDEEEQENQATGFCHECWNRRNIFTIKIKKIKLEFKVLESDLYYGFSRKVAIKYDEFSGSYGGP